MYKYYLAQTLTELILNENHIGPEGAQHLGQALRTNKVLYLLIFLLSHACICSLSHKGTENTGSL